MDYLWKYFSVLLLRTNSWGFNHYIKVVCNLFCIFKTRLKFGIFRTTNFFDSIHASSTNLLAKKMSISLFWSVIVKGFIVSRTYLININVTNTIVCLPLHFLSRNFKQAEDINKFIRNCIPSSSFYICKVKKFFLNNGRTFSSI